MRKMDIVDDCIIQGVNECEMLVRKNKARRALAFYHQHREVPISANYARDLYRIAELPLTEEQIEFYVNLLSAAADDGQIKTVAFHKTSSLGVSEFNLSRLVREKTTINDPKKIGSFPRGGGHAGLASPEK